LDDLEPPDERAELLLLVGVELGQFVLPGLQLLVVVREVSENKRELLNSLSDFQIRVQLFS
jgi:hypothetical protein